MAMLNFTKALILLPTFSYFLLFTSMPAFAQKYIDIRTLCVLLEKNDRELTESNFSYFGYYKKSFTNKEESDNNFYDNYSNQIQLNSETNSLTYAIRKCNKETLSFYKKEIRSFCYDGFSAKDDEQVRTDFFHFLTGRFTIGITFINETDLLLIFFDNANKKGKVFAKSAYRSEDLVVYVNSFTNITRTIVKAGQQVFFRVKEGKIKFGAFAGSGGPDGIDGFTNYNYVRGFRHGALLGKIGDSDWFLIGAKKTFIASTSGLLFLTVNDGTPNDNEGEFLVEYSIDKPLDGSK